MATGWGRVIVPRMIPDERRTEPPAPRHPCLFERMTSQHREIQGRAGRGWAPSIAAGELLFLPGIPHPPPLRATDKATVLPLTLPVIASERLPQWSFGAASVAIVSLCQEGRKVSAPSSPRHDMHGPLFERAPVRSRRKADSFQRSARTIPDCSLDSYRPSLNLPCPPSASTGNAATSEGSGRLSEGAGTKVGVELGRSLSHCAPPPPRSA